MPDKTFDLSILFKMVDRFSGPLRRSMHTFSKWTNQTNRANQAMHKFGQNMTKYGGKMRNVGQKMSLGITAPLTLLGLSSLRVARDFEASMNMVGAVTRTKIGGQVTPAFKALREEAKRLGAITIFTTQQIADGMQVLGLKGLDVNKIFKVMPKVLELATSAQMDIASAANIVIGIMNSQKLSISELATVNDTLVSAFTRSSANLSSLGESFKYAGNITRVTGLTIQEAAAAFAFMAKQNIDASMAGTAMRTGMVKLAAPTKQMIKIMGDLGVKIFEIKKGKRVLRPFLDVLREFEKAGADAVKMTELLGLRAGPGFATLIGQSEGLEKLIKLMGEDFGIAAQIAQTQMTGLPKILAELAAAWEIVRIAFMESKFGQWVQKVLAKFTDWLRKIAKTNPDLLAIAASVLALVAVLGPLVALFGMLAAGIGLIIANATVVGIIAAITASFALMTATVIWLIKHLDRIKRFFVEDIPRAIKTAIRAIVEFITKIPKMVEKLARVIKSKVKEALPDWIANVDIPSSVQAAEIGNELFSNKINPQSTVKAGGEITIKVKSDNGSAVTVERVKKSGDVDLKVINDNYLGYGLLFD